MAGNNKVIRLQCVPQTYECTCIGGGHSTRCSDGLGTLPGGKVGADSLVADFGPQACGPDWKLGKSTPYAEVSLSIS